MGKKYLDTKEGTLESSILGVWRDAVGVQEEDNPSSRVDARTKSYREHRAKLEAARMKREQKKLDPVNKKAVMKKFDDRKDRDIDNDGDVDSTDKYLHKRRQAISKAIKKEEVELDEETIIDKVKDIVKRKSAAKIDGVTVDLFTASAISQIYDKVNPMNKKKMEKLPITKLASAAMKVMQKNEYVPEDMTVTASTDGGISQRDLDYVQKELRKLGIRDAVVDQNEMDSNKIDVKTKMSDAKVKKAFDKSKMTVNYEHVDLDERKLKEYYEIGTAKYLKHAQNVTPGEPGSEAEEYTNVSYFKVKDMREALKKVWGLQEEEKVKKEGEKTETGKKMAKVDTEPKMGA